MKYIDIKTKSTFDFQPIGIEEENLYPITADQEQLIFSYGGYVDFITENGQIINIIPKENEYQEQLKFDEEQGKYFNEIYAQKEAKQREQLRPYSELATTDYKIIKAMEEFLISQPNCSEEILQIHEQRQANRDLINSREEQ